MLLASASARQRESGKTFAATGSGLALGAGAGAAAVAVADAAIEPDAAGGFGAIELAADAEPIDALADARVAGAAAFLPCARASASGTTAAASETAAPTK